METIKVLVCHPDGTEEWVEREKTETTAHEPEPSTAERLAAVEAALLAVLGGADDV